MIREKIANFKYKEEIFLKLIENESSFVDAFIEIAPEIEADIKSFSLNSNCSCKEHIKNFILKGENQQKLFNFLCDFLSSNEEIQVDFDRILLEKEPPYIGGRIAKTSIKDWGEFSEKLIDTNSRYKSFSILKDGDDILVFFL